jgi:S1-C subfamily serine protease
MKNFLALTLTVLLTVGVAVAFSSEAAEPAALRVRAAWQTGPHVQRTSHGSAAAIDCAEFGLRDPRYLLTAAHVVSHAGATVTAEIGGRWVGCEVVRFDADADLALLKTASDVPLPAPLAPDEALRVSGSPEGRPVMTAEGRVTALQAAMPMAHGMSGGPAFNARGELAGVIVSGEGIGPDGAMRSDTARIVSAGVVRAFLSKR